MQLILIVLVILILFKLDDLTAPAASAVPSAPPVPPDPMLAAMEPFLFVGAVFALLFGFWFAWKWINRGPF